MINISKKILNTILNFNKYTWINIFTTILFFLIVQTLFFIFIGSKQYDTLLLSKSKILSHLGKYNNNVKQSIDIIKTDAELSGLKERADNARKIRNSKNKKLLIKYCIIPIIIITLILSFILLYIFLSKTTNKNKWTYIETINLILILSSYLTELYFFFFIVRKYEIIGDHELIYKSFKSLSNNLELQLSNITTTTNSN
jgi:hypothetical protein